MAEMIILSLLFAMFLILLHAGFSKHIFDQVLTINTFGTITILLIVGIGLLSGREYFIDIALLYALVNFVSMIAWLRLFKKKGQGWLAFFNNIRRRLAND